MKNKIGLGKLNINTVPTKESIAYRAKLIKETRAKEAQNKIPIWDFDTALGDIIREKCESQYVKIVEVTNVINRKVIRMDTKEVKKALTPTPKKRKFKWTFEGLTTVTTKLGKIYPNLEENLCQNPNFVVRIAGHTLI